MELQLTGKESGWWIVSHENKLWLPKGELPQGNAANWSLQGTTARQIGEWQGQSVWLIRQMMPSGMGSVRQLLDVDRGLIPIGRARCAISRILSFTSLLWLLWA